MEAFQTALSVLDSVVKQLENEDPSFVDEGIPPSSPSRSVLEPIPEDRAGASTLERTKWAIELLDKLYDQGFISESEERSSISRAQRDLLQKFRRLSSSYEGLEYAQWMEATYTNLQNVQQQKLTQASFRRSTRNYRLSKRVRRKTRRKTRGVERSSSHPHFDVRLLEPPDDSRSLSSLSEEPSEDDTSGQESPRPSITAHKKFSLDSSQFLNFTQCLSGQDAFNSSLTSVATMLDFTPTSQCAAFLDTFHRWEMDVFELNDLTEGHPLFMIGMRIFQSRDLFNTMKLPQSVMAKFLYQVEEGYSTYPDVPYHNREHGADVLHSVHMLLSSPALEESFSQTEIFSALIAAAVHDLGHFGHNNNFLVKTQHPLSILYNDISVLENHHAASAFKIMSEDPECNVLSCLDPADRQVVRKLIIDMVLATDMVKHTQFLAEFKDLLQRKNNRGVSAKELLFESPSDRTLALCNVVHAADLGSAAKPWPICEKMTDRLMREFQQEGDEEKRLEIEIQALNGRSVDIPKAQVGFFRVISKPLWEAWSLFACKSVDTLQMRYLNENLAKWQAMCKPDPTKEQHAVCKPGTKNPGNDPSANATTDASPVVNITVTTSQTATSRVISETVI